MTSQGQHRSWTLEINHRAVTVALSLTLLFASLAFLTPAAQAQYKKIHDFTGGQDGATPEAGVFMDPAENLYGTTSAGSSGEGTVYRLHQRNGSSVFSPLYSFIGGGTDGANPMARVIFRNGVLYGTTFLGDNGYGTVFKLQPQPTACKAALCPWKETVLVDFYTAADGDNPGFGDLIFDAADNIYGTTTNSRGCCGVVYQLTPSGAVNILYTFPYPGTAGYYPWNGVIFDSSGKPDNLYGTTLAGGLHQYGTVFHLNCAVGGCQENLLHSFGNGSDGGHPYAGLVFDKTGNLYGAAGDGGTGGGVVFELSPPGDWTTLTPLYSFTGSATGNCPARGNGTGPGPWASLTIDPATGNLYGTTVCDGNGFGNIFELTYSGGNYTYKDLYDFTGGSDGAYPISNVTLHYTNGLVDRLYGTASAGGSQGVGVAWEFTP